MLSHITPSSPERRREGLHGGHESAEYVADNAEQLAAFSHPTIMNQFRDAGLLNALPHTISRDPINLSEYIEHCSRFLMRLRSERDARLRGQEGLFCEEVFWEGEDGSQKSGFRIDIDHLRSMMNVDPTKVLCYRKTVPSLEAKEENDWTTNYIDAKNEHVEVDGKAPLVMVANLAELSRLGPVASVTDEGGLAIHFISPTKVSQKSVISLVWAE